MAEEKALQGCRRSWCAAPPRSLSCCFGDILMAHPLWLIAAVILLLSPATASKAAKAARGIPVMNGAELARSLHHPRQPPSPPPSPPPPSPAPPPHLTTCLNFPPIASNGTSLVINDGTGRRFFSAGMVESGGAPLLGFNQSHFEKVLADSRALGANTLRWNAFLKGLDFEWAPSASVASSAGEPKPAFVARGLRAGCFEAMRAGLDLAQRHGLVVQIVLVTAHFLRYGYGGEGGEQRAATALH